MKIGTFATFMSPYATPAMIADFGIRAEQAGLDSIWMGEHVLLFDEMENPYPGSRDGRIPVPEGGGMLDTVATFGFLASATSSIRLGTGICLVPQRNPVYTAKEFATLDWLSQGRVDFGIGVGWCKEEVIACGYSWEDRGGRCDEFLELMQSLWTEEVTNYDGQHVQVTGARLDPKPIQQPHLPIIVGGHGAPSLRRAARFGSGWYGFALTPAQTAPILTRLDEALDEAERDRQNYQIIITPPYDVDDAMLNEFAELGVHRLVVQLGSQKSEKITQRFVALEALAKQAERL